MQKMDTFGGFTIEREIGEGSFAKVYLGKDSNGKEVAIKQVLRDEIESEILVHSTLKHPNIVKFYGYFCQDNMVWMILEHIKGITLYDLMEARRCEPMTEDQVQYIILQVVKAIRHCHKNHVYHRDVKLENIMLTTNGKVKVIDFGLAEVSLSGEFKSAVGSLEYCAPEILLNDHYDGSKTDVFSIGVVLYSLLAGILPFGIRSKQQFVRGFKPHPVMEIDALALSTPSKDLMARSLAMDPTQRISITEMAKHPWLKNGLYQRIKRELTIQPFL